MTGEPACREHMELFTEGQMANGQVKKAAAICAPCPVRDACETYAREHYTLTNPNTRPNQPCIIAGKKRWDKRIFEYED